MYRRGFSVLALAFLLAIWYSPGLGAQTQPNSEKPTPEQQKQLSNLLSILLTLRVVSLQLGDDLTAWPAQIKSLQDNSAQLQQQLTDSQASLTASQEAQQQTSDELAKSQTSLTKLSESFASYREASAAAQRFLEEEVIRERADKMKWEIAGIVGASVAVLAGGYLGGRALHIW